MSKSADGSSRLKVMMQAAGYRSYRQLSKKTGISLKSLRKIRKGNAVALRLRDVLCLAKALQVSGATLLEALDINDIGNVQPPEHPACEIVVPPLAQPAEIVCSEEMGLPESELARVQAEYQRLQGQQHNLQQQISFRVQQEALQTLEPWLQFWPVAAKAAAENSGFPATKLLPLCRPIEVLLSQWQVQAIAPVGSEVAYDPQVHQLMEGTAQPGDRVRIRYPGYWHQDKLLLRSRVSPLPTEE